MNRNTALQLVERKSWGGSYVDYTMYSAMFKKYAPHDFGVKMAQLFSSQPGTFALNKKFTQLTLAQGNVYRLPGGVDDYKWQLVASATVKATITELLVDPASFPGKGKMEFKIALDKDWFHEPVLLKTKNANLPLLRIVGHPIQRSANSFEYTVILQTGDENAYIPVEYLRPGEFVIDGATSVSDNLNYKYGGDQYAEMFSLQSHVGNYARKIEFDDKTIRAEVSARTTPGGRVTDDKNGIGVGYVYQENLRNPGTNEMVEKGVFITKAEARLLDRVEMDREFMMEFGQTETTYDPDSSSTVKVAPGWRQICRDGHYLPHNGNLNLDQIFEFFMTIFINKANFDERQIKVSTGQAGALLFHRLLEQEASGFTRLDTTYIQENASQFHTNSLQFGVQYTKWLAPNGLVVEIVHDPIKDNPSYFPEKAPGSNYTIESFCMDIYDFGATTSKPAGGSDSNICMVMQDGVEEYYAVSSIYNFATGAINDGSNVNYQDKKAGIYRSTSGSLCVWDVTRVGRIEFIPGLV